MYHWQVSDIRTNIPFLSRNVPILYRIRCLKPVSADPVHVLVERIQIRIRPVQNLFNFDLNILWIENILPEVRTVLKVYFLYCRNLMYLLYTISPFFQINRLHLHVLTVLHRSSKYFDRRAKIKLRCWVPIGAMSPAGIWPVLYPPRSLDGAKVWPYFIVTVYNMLLVSMKDDFFFGGGGAKGT
jgi:hypothetical protein